jgi:hypothetical protein
VHPCQAAEQGDAGAGKWGIFGGRRTYSDHGFSICTHLPDDAACGIATDVVAGEPGVDFFLQPHGVDAPQRLFLRRDVLLLLGEDREVGAQAHGDAAREELGQAADDDEAGGAYAVWASVGCSPD